MKIRRRRSARGRPDWRSLHERRPPLAGQAWFRSGRRRARREADGGHRWGRILAVGAALAETLLIGLLLLGPFFQVREVRVQGTQRLTADEVLAAAGVGKGGSIFAVDPGAVGRRLEGSPWIRTASVSTRLPNAMTIRVEEWSPVAVYEPSRGGPW